MKKQDRFLSLFLVLLFLLAPFGHTQAAVRPPAGNRTPADDLPAGLTDAEWGEVQSQIEAGRYAFRPGAPASYRAANRAHALQADFTPQGLSVTSPGGAWWLKLSLVAYGYRHALQAVGQPQLSAQDNRLIYAWDRNLSEWWLNTSDGLEQGFTLQYPPAFRLAADAALVLEMALQTGLVPAQVGDAVHFLGEDGAAVVVYDKLFVYDAAGRTLPASMQLAACGDASAAGSCRLQLVVDDRAAVYPLTVDPVLQQAYIKASNTQSGDSFGQVLALSGDTLVVGAPQEDSNATGVNGDQSNNLAGGSGAAYVFVRSGTTWSQQAYLKASNTDVDDHFGWAVAISGDTLVIGAPDEDSSATGVGGNQADNSVSNAGAAYVFVRSGTTWSQQAYVKASNPESADRFGAAVAISGDSVVIGAWGEDSNATGIGGNQGDNTAGASGAVYAFSRSGTAWSQEAYIKASNTGSDDRFGSAVALDNDTLVVGAYQEDGDATGIGGPSNNNASNAGAAYIFVRSGSAWSQQAYVKASNTNALDTFGLSVGVSGDTVVIGAPGEDSSATGIDGNQSDNTLPAAGAAYIFVRSGSAWSQQAYLKASNTGLDDNFGQSAAVSGDLLAVGAYQEDSSATGTNGDPANNLAADSGAAYVFARSGATWVQQSYIKASNTGSGDRFGGALTLSGDTVAVGAQLEDSNATGIGGVDNNVAADAGAVYALLSSFDIAVKGNGQTIPSGDTTPSLSDDTDFGNVYLGTPASHTFTISYTGGTTLTVNSIALSGAGAANFNVSGIALPAAVAPNSSTTFDVTMDPAAPGVYSATLAIANSDPDESPYTFIVQGTGVIVSPSVTTQAVSGIGINVATGNGTLTDLGAPNPTAHGMVWNTTGSPTLADASSDEGAATSTGAFTSTLSGLLPNTTYYVRAYATNTAGTAYGGQVSFTTAPEPASVTTQAVSGIGINAATGNGTLTDLGAPNPTAHGMVWNTTGSPTLADASSDEGVATSTGAFTSTLSGLLPNTTYYVRAYATNTAGTAYGGQVSFTTAPEPASVTTQAVSGIGINAATGNGTLTDLGAPNPTAHGMVWNTTGSPTLADASSDEGAATSTGAFTSMMSGLLPNTTYYVRAYATNAAGTAYGGQVSFTTAPEPASVTTQAVSGIGINAATGNGTLTDLGAPNPTAHGMVWNTTGSPTLADASSDEGAATSTGAFTSMMSGLLPNTTYYVRAYATNTAGTAYGGQVSFTTAPEPASVTTQAVSGIGINAATGNGTLTDLGAPNPTAHGMVWNTTGSPTLADASSDEGAATSTGAFTSTLSGLLPGTTYYVRAYATNAAGTAYGNEVSFTTQPPLLPSVTTQAATAVGMTDAVGNGTLTDLGVPNPTAHGMVWNTTGGPTLAGASSDEGAATSTGAFTSTLSGLLPGTTYYVRAYATNAAGTAYGNEVSFMTAPPISASVTTQAVSGIGINAATGNGTLTDLGAPNPTAHGMVWNTAGGPTLADASSDEGAATNTGAFTSTLSGLLPGTTYYVRAYATNAAGTAYGDVVTFTTATLPAEPAEMDVLGNGLSIASGSSTPSVSDGTDFSSVAVGMASITHTFTIRNTGDDVLALLGNPAVEITGTHAADFQVIVQPDVSVAADSSVTFAVIFTPSAAGLRTATISIASSDTDENPYTFVVQGAGFQAGYRIYLPVAMR